MASKFRKRRRRKIHLSQPDVSQTLPGTVEHVPPRPTGEAEVFAYNTADFIEVPAREAGDLVKLVEKWSVSWINVDGTGDSGEVLRLGALFNLHELAIEDIVNLHQRAKVDVYNDQLFIILRMPTWIDGQLHQEQLCIVLGDKFVLTFQEEPGGDSLDPVRDRIRKGYGQIRSSKSDYLAYSIIDAVVDGYFPVIERIGDALEELEDEILERFDRLTPAKILELKREILNVKRAIWPAREALNLLVRDDLPHIQPHTKIYFRDCYDHVIRIIDLVEQQREMCSDLMDLYLSSASNRMNEVMKVLTMITLIFMPPTLVAGIYGMNFNNQISPFNMPELNWKFGYEYALALMVFSALLVWGLARLRGWSQDEIFDSRQDPNGAAQSPASNVVQK